MIKDDEGTRRSSIDAEWGGGIVLHMELKGVKASST